MLLYSAGPRKTSGKDFDRPSPIPGGGVQSLSPSGIALACSVRCAVESVESVDNRLQTAWMLGFRIRNFCIRTFVECGYMGIRIACTARLESLPRHHHARRAMLPDARQ